MTKPIAETFPLLTALNVTTADIHYVSADQPDQPSLSPRLHAAIRQHAADQHASIKTVSVNLTAEIFIALKTRAYPPLTETADQHD